jgi:polyisoprenoid-binding protein YceI
MKQLFIALLLSSTGFAQAQTPDGKYSLSVTESIITWKVDYSIGKKGHEGTLKLVSGSIMLKNGLVENGNFIIDMNSVHVTDMPPDDGGKSLEEHLRNDDFLSTPTYPKAFFTVIKSTKDAATQKTTTQGYLIMKGISNIISFPVIITEGKNMITVRSAFAIDRTKWGINYQSGSVFASLKDDLISDTMNVTLNFSFKKTP